MRFSVRTRAPETGQAKKCCLERMAQGETLTAIAKSYNISHMTICRLQT